MELDGQPLCRILDSGTIRYWEKDIGNDSRREILENACTQIERAVPNLDALVQESNQEELRLGASWLEQGY